MLIKMKLYNHDPSLIPDSREHRDFATLLYHFNGFVHPLSTWQLQCSQHCIPSLLQAHRLVAQEVHPQSPFCYLYVLICIHNTYVVTGRTTSYDAVQRRTTTYVVVRRRTQCERPLLGVHTAYVVRRRTWSYNVVLPRTLSHAAVRRQWVNDLHDVDLASSSYLYNISTNSTSTLLCSRRAAPSR